MKVPANKYLLEDYRRDMKTVDAPQEIDTQINILPVKNVGAGVPVPNSAQRLRYKVFSTDANATQNQIATVSAQYNYYFLGFWAQNGTANNQSLYIYDASSGAAPVFAAGNGYDDPYIFVAAVSGTTVAQDHTYFVPFPIKVTSGIRLQWGASAGASQNVIVFYIEERAY